MAYERKLLGSTYQELVRIQGTEQIVSGGRKLRFTAGSTRPRDHQRGSARARKARATVPSDIARYRPNRFRRGRSGGGYANGGLFPNGAWNFSGHFHDSGFPSYDVGMAVAVRLGGVTFVLSIQGHVAGTIGSGSRDFDWNTSGTNPALAQALPVDDYEWSWNAAADISIGDLIDSVTGAVGAAVKIISLL